MQNYFFPLNSNSSQGLHVTFSICLKIFISLKLNIQPALNIGFQEDQWGSLWACFSQIWSLFTITRVYLLSEKEVLLFCCFLSVFHFQYNKKSIGQDSHHQSTQKWQEDWLEESFKFFCAHSNPITSNPRCRRKLLL